MTHQGSFEVEGEVIENLPSTLFRVKIVDTAPETLRGRVILCHISGKLRLNFIKILPGDKVKLEMTPYDLNKGRIIYRMK